MAAFANSSSEYVRSVVGTGDIAGCAGVTGTVCSAGVSEAFAHMFEAQFDKERYEQMGKYFPNALKYFEKKIKEAL